MARGLFRKPPFHKIVGAYRSNGSAFGCVFSPLVCTAEKEWAGGTTRKKRGITSGITVHPSVFLAYLDTNRHGFHFFAQCSLHRLRAFLRRLWMQQELV